MSFFSVLAVAVILFIGAELFLAFKEHFCKIILKSGLWPRRRCHLKVFLFLALAAILFSGAERY